MIKHVLTEAQLKIQGTLVPKNRKLYLYSGHEYNIAHVLGALGIFKPHVPPYASYIIIEFHKINNIYGFKVNMIQNNVMLSNLMLLFSFCTKIIKLRIPDI